MVSFGELTLTWKHLHYNFCEVADNVQHGSLSQVLVWHVWGVISKRQ